MYQISKAMHQISKAMHQISEATTSAKLSYLKSHIINMVSQIDYV